MDNIVLSIIIPVYNVKDYIGQCLNSIFNQDMENFEVIVVNDGSTDNSIEIVHTYSEKHQNLILLHKENGGLSSARNYGMQFAKGKYVWFIDSDDYIKPNSISPLVHLIETKKVHAIWFNGMDIYPDNESKVLRKSLDLNNKILPGIKLFKQMLKNKTYQQPVWLFIYNVEFLKKNNISFIDSILHEDEPYTSTVLTLADKIICLDDIIYYHRMREDSIMGQSITEKHIKDIITIIQYYKSLGEQFPNNYNIYNYRTYQVIKSLVFRVNKNKMHKSLNLYKKNIHQINFFNNKYFNIAEKIDYILLKLQLILGGKYLLK